MNKTTAAIRLRSAADQLGVTPVLALCGCDLKLRIPMTRTLWDTSIENLNLSVRAYNGLRRAGADTIGRVCEIIMSETGLSAVRNLGKKSVSEIKTAVIIAGYEQLSHAEKLDFWQHFIDSNFDSNFRGGCP